VLEEGEERCLQRSLRRLEEGGWGFRGVQGGYGRSFFSRAGGVGWGGGCVWGSGWGFQRSGRGFRWTRDKRRHEKDLAIRSSLISKLELKQNLIGRCFTDPLKEIISNTI
jgi:hypothetical protein